MTSSPQMNMEEQHKKGRLLIVDDEVELTSALTELLAKHGYDATGFTSASKALAILQDQKFDIILADLMMPEMDGVSFIRAALKLDPQVVCIIMTGQGTVQTAVDAMKSGAFDYILKPFKLNAILFAISHSMEVGQLRKENSHLKEMVNIYELGQTVAFNLDINLIMDKTTEAARVQTQADEVSILLPVEENQSFVIASAQGKSEYLIGKKVPVQGTISGWVAGHLEPMSLQGLVSDDRFPASFPRPEIQSSISMPMITGNRLVGVININHTRHKDELTEGQIKSLSVLIGIAASAMENARLYEQTEKRLGRLSALRTIDQAITSSLDLRLTLTILLDQVATQLGVDAVTIRLFNRSTHILEFGAGRGLHTHLLDHSQVLLGVGYAGSAALERKVVQVIDLNAGEPDPYRERLISDEGFAAYFVAPLIAKGELEGVLEVYHRSTMAPNQEWFDFFEALAGQAAIAINNAKLFDHLQEKNQQLTAAYDATIEGWSRALDLRDKETEGHTQRVTQMTLRLAHAIGGFDEDDFQQIRRGALLHDIGKMGVPDQILLKAGDLNEEEWQVMQKHPEYAYQLLYPITYLRKALDIPHYHHEHWDGGGYPEHLRGEQIPLAARIFSVVDVWDALRSERTYHQAMPDQEVMEYLRERAGLDFDPNVVRAFLQMMENEGGVGHE